MPTHAVVDLTDGDSMRVGSSFRGWLQVDLFLDGVRRQIAAEDFRRTWPCPDPQAELGAVPGADRPAKKQRIMVASLLRRRHAATRRACSRQWTWLVARGGNRSPSPTVSPGAQHGSVRGARRFPGFRTCNVVEELLTVSVSQLASHVLVWKWHAWRSVWRRCLSADRHCAPCQREISLAGTMRE